MSLSIKAKRIAALSGILLVVGAALVFYLKNYAGFFYLIAALGIIIVAGLCYVGYRSEIFQNKLAIYRRRSQIRREINRQWQHAKWRFNKAALKSRTLYTYPFFLMLGRDDKEKLLLNKGSSSAIPFIEDGGDAAPTWWLANEAMIIDVPAAFFSGADDDGYRWQYFLKKLRRERRYLALDGVLYVVSASELLNGENTDVAVQGDLAVVNAALNTEVPTYLVVSSLDDVTGLHDLIDQLDHKQAERLLGDTRVSSVAALMLDVRERIEEIRFEMLVNKSSTVSPNSFQYGPELAKCGEKLQRIHDALSKSLIPKIALRGVFLTAKRLEKLPSGREYRGVFCRELYADTLRRLSVSSGTLGSVARRYIDELVLGGLCVAAIVLFTILFMQNITLLDRAASVNGSAAIDDIGRIAALKNFIAELDDASIYQKAFLFGRDRGLKPKFNTAVEREIIDKNSRLVIAEVEQDIENERLERLREHFFRMVGMLGAADRGDIIFPVNAGPDDGSQANETASKHRQIYRILEKYKEWNDDYDVQKYQTLMNTYLILTERIIRKFGISSVLDAEVTTDANEKPTFAHYRRKVTAYRDAMALLDKLYSIQLLDKSLLKQQQESVATGYVAETQRYIAEVRRVGISQDGSDYVRAVLNHDSSYNALLAMIGEDVSALGRDDGNQELARFSRFFAMLKRFEDADYVKTLGAPEEGVLSKLKKGGKDILGSIKNATSNDEELDRQIYPAWKIYQDSTREVARGAIEKKSAYEMTRAAYAETVDILSEVKNPINMQFLALQRLNAVIAKYNDELEPSLLKVYEREMIDLADVSERNTVDYVNEAWQEEIVMRYADDVGWKRLELVDGEKGKLWEFGKKYIGDFIQKTGDRYHAKEKRGRRIKINTEIMSLLNQRESQQVALKDVYKIKVQTLPTDVNKDALAKPYMTKVTINCASENIEIVNENYPSKKHIQWKPEECGDVTLEINFGKTKVEKRYVGFYGLVEFIKEFRSGQRVFRKDDMYEYRDLFAQYQISTISVNFKFDGVGELAKLKTQAIDNLPKMIVEL